MVTVMEFAPECSCRCVNTLERVDIPARYCVILARHDRWREVLSGLPSAILMATLATGTGGHPANFNHAGFRP
jgi:hypothetical protein